MISWVWPSALGWEPARRIVQAIWLHPLWVLNGIFTSGTTGCRGSTLPTSAEDGNDGFATPRIGWNRGLVREILTFFYPFLILFCLFGKIQQLPNFGVASPGLRSKLLTFGLHLFARIVWNFRNREVWSGSISFHGQIHIYIYSPTFYDIVCGNGSNFSTCRCISKLGIAPHQPEMKKFKSKARDLHVMKARSTSQSSCGLGSLGQRQEMLSFHISPPESWSTHHRSGSTQAETAYGPADARDSVGDFGRKGNGAGKNQSFDGKDHSISQPTNQEPTSECNFFGQIHKVIYIYLYLYTKIQRSVEIC